jgi:hypothetical protein
MSKRISIAKTRNPREGRSVAALVPLQEYRSLASTPRDLWSAIQQFRQTHDLSDLNIEEVYAGIRDPSPGRAPDE